MVAGERKAGAGGLQAVHRRDASIKGRLKNRDNVPSLVVLNPLQLASDLPAQAQVGSR
jgi:hypothetical protein